MFKKYDYSYDQEKYNNALAAAPTTAQSETKNFALHNFNSNVRVYPKSCQGTGMTGADIMLTFGSKIAVLDGNNRPTAIEYPRHVDVFLNRKQAEDLLKELAQALGK